MASRSQTVGHTAVDRNPRQATSRFPLWQARNSRSKSSAPSFRRSWAKLAPKTGRCREEETGLAAAGVGLVVTESPPVLEGQDKFIPEFNHIVLRYKQLKKKIKAIPKRQRTEQLGAEGQEALAAAAAAAVADAAAAAAAGAGPSVVAEGAGAGALSAEERDFMSTLNEDVNRFNTFFMEKEEDAVIKLQAMEVQLEQASNAEQLKEVHQRLVNFHGDLVMVLHWSLINYSAIVKILKKHDKRSGVLLRAPYLANVLTQPFSSTNVMSRLVKRAEELVELAEKDARAAVAGAPLRHRAAVAVAAAAAAAAAAAEMEEEASGDGDQRMGESSDDEGSSLTEVSGHAEPAIRKTKLALAMWDSLARSASTPSTILQPGEAAASQQQQQQQQQQAAQHPHSEAGATTDPRQQPRVGGGAMPPPAAGSFERCSVESANGPAGGAALD